MDATLLSYKKIKHLVLTEEEWTKVDIIIEFLLPFREATKIMSASCVPRLSDTVLIYGALFEHLESYCKEACSTEHRSVDAAKETEAFPKWIVDAATEAWMKLKDYHPTVDGLVYSVATSEFYLQ